MKKTTSSHKSNAKAHNILVHVISTYFLLPKIMNGETNSLQTSINIMQNYIPYFLTYHSLSVSKINTGEWRSLAQKMVKYNLI
jgi:hypothetical protein